MIVKLLLPLQKKIAWEKEFLKIEKAGESTRSDYSYPLLPDS